MCVPRAGGPAPPALGGYELLSVEGRQAAMGVQLRPQEVTEVGVRVVGVCGNRALAVLHLSLCRLWLLALEGCAGDASGCEWLGAAVVAANLQHLSLL